MEAVRYRVFDPQAPAETLAILTFTPGKVGDTGFVAIEAEQNVREFLMYYLDDPLGQSPVYIHGLGEIAGPHSEDAEQLDAALSVLQHRFPRFAAGRI